MSEEYTDDELDLIKKHRAAKAKNGRKVKVRGRHEDSGAEYEFDLDGEEAERVISRHKSLFEEAPPEAETKTPVKKSAGPYFKGKD
jgi:hypothetical protein